MYIDTHIHLYDESYENELPELLKRAEEHKIAQLYIPNCDQFTIVPMLDLCDTYKQCKPMIGIHPCYIKENYEQELTIAFDYLQKHSFSAIGEVGLDYHWDKTFIPQQKKAFQIQIEWAKEYNLPLVIHTRESIDDGIELVRQAQNGKLKGIFHCFSGTEEQAKAIIDMGFYLGIGGTITFKNNPLRNFIASLPIDKIVLETDGPYLAPQPYRGKRNESAYIPLIAQEIANLKNTTIESVAQMTTKNAKIIFN